METGVEVEDWLIEMLGRARVRDALHRALAPQPEEEWWTPKEARLYFGLDREQWKLMVKRRGLVVLCGKWDEARRCHVFDARVLRALDRQ